MNSAIFRKQNHTTCLLKQLKLVKEFRRSDVSSIFAARRCSTGVVGVGKCCSCWKKTNEPCFSLEVRKNVASAEDCRNLCYNKKRQENLPDCTYWVGNKLQKLGDAFVEQIMLGYICPR